MLQHARPASRSMTITHILGDNGMTVAVQLKLCILLLVPLSLLYKLNG